MLGSGAAFTANYKTCIIESGDVEHSYVFQRSPSSTSPVALTWQVEVSSSHRWRGIIYADRPPVRAAVTDIFSTPDAATMCAVANGDAFLINCDDPGAGTYLSTGGPVVIIASAIEDNVLLLASPWVITAVGSAGLAWRTERLSIEALRLDEIADGWVRGVSDPDEDEARNFAVNLRSGARRGGFRGTD